MKIKYFDDTDTLLLIFFDGEVAETRELDENTYLDMDKDGKLVSMTLEHAKDRTNLEELKIERVAA